MNTTKMKILALALALAATFSISNACMADETIYKGVDEKGNIVYSNNPQGLKKAQKVKLPEQSIQGTEAPIATPTPSVIPKARADSDVPKKQGLFDADKKIADAQAAADAGKEPLPNERIGTSGGASRLTPEYFTRQQSLADALAKAKAEQAAGSGRSN